MTAKKKVTLKQAQQYMESGEWVKAEKAFAGLLTESEDPVVRNNLARSQFQQKKYQTVLATLQPNLGSEVMNPYARCLAAQAQIMLGAGDEAEKFLNQAVVQFTWGASQQNPEWFKYLTMLYQTAGMLEKHRLILEWHQKWGSRYAEPETSMYASFANFNLGRYKQAKAIWRRLSADFAIIICFETIVSFIENGIIPAFDLDYLLLDIPGEFDDDWLIEHIRLGQIKMLIFYLLFDDDTPPQQRNRLIGLLVRHCDEWGRKLAQSLLKSNSIDMTLKMGIAEQLIEMGVYRPDEPIPMRVDGQDKLVKVQKIGITESLTPEIQKVLEESVELIKQNQPDKAADKLRNLYLQGIAYPPAMQLLAQLYFQQKRHEEARMIAESLLQVDSENQDLLLLMAQICIQTEQYAQAQQYIDRLDPEKAPPELRGVITELCKESADEAGDNFDISAAMANHYEHYMWNEVLCKPLPQKRTLLNSLKKIPVHWLDAICRVYEIEPAKRRQQREIQISEAIGRRDDLSQIIANLPSQSRDVLKDLVLAGGKKKISAFTRKFGPLDGDNYFWMEDPPQTPLGQLILNGLVFVGTERNANGRSYKMAAIPEDLVDKLSPKNISPNIQLFED